MMKILKISMILLILGAFLSEAMAGEVYIFRTKIGSPGTGDGQFLHPFGIASDSKDNIYVTDWKNSCVQKFDSTGNFILKFGSTGAGDGQFINPAGIAIDGDGNIYVADYNNSRIQKFDNTGKFIAKFSTSGNPFGVVIQPIGSVNYIFATLGDTVQKFSSSGDLRSKWGGDIDYYFSGGNNNYLFSNITLSSHKYVFLPCRKTSKTNTDSSTFETYIFKYDLSGLLVEKWLLASYDSKSGLDFGITSDTDGNIFTASYRGNYINKYNSQGKLITSFGTSGNTDGQFNGPLGITVDLKGNVYVVDSGNCCIQKFSK